MPTPDMGDGSRRVNNRKYIVLADEAKRRKVLARKRWRGANPTKQRAISKAQSRKRRASHPGEGREASARWRKANPEEAKERGRRQHYKSSYGITPEQRDDMLKAQGGVCAVCVKPKATNTRWHLDHCHTTGKVRGVLCHHCNLSLGHAHDDIATLKKLIAYLRKYQ